MLLGMQLATVGILELPNFAHEICFICSRNRFMMKANAKRTSNDENIKEKWKAKRANVIEEKEMVKKKIMKVLDVKSENDDNKNKSCHKHKTNFIFAISFR